MQTSLLDLLKRGQNYKNLFEHFLGAAYLGRKATVVQADEKTKFLFLGYINLDEKQKNS